MLILQPIDTIQTLSIMPRKSVETDAIDIVVRKDGYGQERTISNVPVVEKSYYSDIEVSLDFLTEGDTYYVEMLHNGELWYRDKIYVTSQLDFKVKHKQSLNNYDQYNEVDDNTYIIRN